MLVVAQQLPDELQLLLKQLTWDEYSLSGQLFWVLLVAGGAEAAV